MILKLLNSQLYILCNFITALIKKKIQPYLIHLFFLALLLNIFGYFINSIFINYILILILLLFIVSNNIINSFFSLLILIKYLLPLFLDYNDFSHTNESPDLINNFIFFSSTSIILLFNINCLFDKREDEYIFNISFNLKFLKIIFIISIINFIVFYSLNDLKIIPFFSQIYSKSLYLFIIPLVMNSMNKNLDKVDYAIISISIFNLLLLIVYQGFSRSLLIIIFLISIFFLFRNPLQVISVIVLLFFLYPFFMLLRAFPDQLTFKNLFFILSSFKEYGEFCIIDRSENIHPPTFYLYSNIGLFFYNCEVYYHLFSSNFFDLTKYIRFLLTSFFERLYGTFEFGMVMLNESYLNKNYYINNIFALLPSLFIEKPNFFFYQGYQLFEFALKPITDFKSTASFGIIPESISILKSYYIFPFLALTFFLNIINYILKVIGDYNFKIAFNVYIISILFFKDSLTSISLDIAFIFFIIFLFKHTKKFFTKKNYVL